MYMFHRCGVSVLKGKVEYCKQFMSNLLGDYNDCKATSCLV